MENGIYWLLDFFKTRGGRLFLAAVIVLMGLAAFKVFNNRNEVLQAKNGGPLPNLEHSTLWGSPETELSDTNDQLSIEKPYKRFEPQERKQLVVIQKPERATFDLKPFQPSEDFVPLPSLIKSQRIIGQPTKRLEPVSLRLIFPEIDHGTLLHCQLVSPVDTAVSASPVVARLTKPLIQRGKLIAPIGTKIYGLYRSSKGNRVYLDEQWKIVAGEQLQLSLKASALEQQYDPSLNFFGLSDGRLGLLARVTGKRDDPGTLKSVVGTLASATAKLAQERVRTVLGDQVPLSARNVLLEGSRAAIDQKLEGITNKDGSYGTALEVDAGTEFYLLVENEERAVHSDSEQSGSTVDSLLQRALQQRLNR